MICSTVTSIFVLRSWLSYIKIYCSRISDVLLYYCHRLEMKYRENLALFRATVFGDWYVTRQPCITRVRYKPCPWKEPRPPVLTGVYEGTDFDNAVFAPVKIHRKNCEFSAWAFLNSTLKVEAVCPFKELASISKTTLCNKPEGHNLRVVLPVLFYQWHACSFRLTLNISVAVTPFVPQFAASLNWDMKGRTGVEELLSPSFINCSRWCTLCSAPWSHIESGL